MYSPPLTHVRIPLFGPVYMRKRFPGKEGQLLILVNLSEHLFEKKVDPFDRAKSKQQRSRIL